MQDYEKSVDGINTIFEEVIQSLRTSLCSIESIRNSEGGALLFFNDELDDGLQLQVFPLRKKSPIFKCRTERSAKTFNHFFELLNKK